MTAHRFLGQLETEDRRFTAAEEHLRQALDLAQACQTPFERALSLLAQSELRLAQGNMADAQVLADEVQTICEPLGAKPTLARVAALEARLATTKVAHPFGLTARELEVLRLVAQGLTDAQIAEYLFVSRRTVGTHLTHILTKLEVNSRAAAVAAAARFNLL